MNSPEADSEGTAVRNPRPWQFGLRELFLVFIALSVLCAAASWSIFSAIFLLGWALCVSQAIWYRRKYPGQKFWKTSAICIGLTVLLLMCFGIPKMQSVRTAAIGKLSFRIVSATDGSPVESADANLIPAVLNYGNTLQKSDSDGLVTFSCIFPATQHAGGWGRMSTTLYFNGTELEISAAGYKSKRVRWEEISQDAYRSADSLPGEPFVIELQPDKSSPKP